MSEDRQRAADARPDAAAQRGDAADARPDAAAERDDADQRSDGDAGRTPAGDEEQQGDEAPPVKQGPPRRRGSGGSVLAAAMLGLRDVLYGKPKEDSIIEIEASGDPPNIDLDGLDEALGRDHRMIGPPLDDIKARAHVRRRGSRARGRHPR